MGKPPREPRYVATFRAGTPEMFVVGLLTVIGAGFAIAIAGLVREIACGEAGGDCDEDTLAPLVIAWLGLIPAVATLVASARRHGRPWRWLLVTASVYGIWGMLEATAI
jgi:hypothetical protein